ncbi:riboflavin synthase [candidate division WOR-3 bacterium]|nr:riboflavin synthase [candidate division WOR-3 bacterium]
MFTGLVETIGKVVRVVPKQGNRRLVIEADFAQELQPGESVAVNGCCLTVVGVARRRFEVEVVAETLKRTNLRDLRSGTPVNLERALRFTDRLGGHFVLGHIDEVGTVRRLEHRSNEHRLFVAVKEASFNLLVEKGSVAIDGVSLTVAGVKRGEFWVNLIPFTWERTTLNRCRAGTRVNLEYDILVKAAQRGQGPHPLVPHRAE